jgi:regulator of protease activity HflC (stomatin/prohibitin superfamily)
MATFIFLTILFLVAIGGGVFFLRRRRTWVVPEDSVAITVDKDSFIKRVLPAGRHILRFHERVDFSLDIRPKLAVGRAQATVTSDGILMNINWSGVYTLQPDLVTEKLNQRLRGLAKAEKAIARSVDITLRKLVGDYSVQELFKPTVRERIERQLSQVVAERVKSLGIVVLGIDLQVIELPGEVAEALNKAKAIQTLDGTIRQLDPTTRDIVRGAYQLDEILHWDQYLPVPSRLTMKRLEAANG